MKKDKIKTFRVEYRREFGADIRAKNWQEAVGKFHSGKAKYELISDLWDDYVEVYDGNGNELNHN